MKKILLTLFSLSIVFQTFAQCPISADAGNGINEKDFNLLIYDRWGEIIFETTKPNDKWDGTIKGKEKANAEVYTFKIYYKDKSGLSHTQTGNFTLIR